MTTSRDQHPTIWQARGRNARPRRIQLSRTRSGEGTGGRIVEITLVTSAADDEYATIGEKFGLAETQIPTSSHRSRRAESIGCGIEQLGRRAGNVENPP